jgi:alkanesulfonate monooxygenase SsuD/methylene tetrahydromethanopterin reductase-like flavin-dependent oxidoreductase (luciferase family)
MKVGLMLPMGEDEASGQVPPWSTLRDMAITAEERGLDSVYLADHLLFRDELVARIARLRAACDAEGRDIATLTLTAGVFVFFPGLAREGDETPPDSAMRGTAEDLAPMLAATPITASAS